MLLYCSIASPMIPRFKSLPASATKFYTTHSDYQKKIKIRVLEGEETAGTVITKMRDDTCVCV